MSRSSRQSLCLLAAANGAIVSAVSGYSIGAEELRAYLDKALEHTATALQVWPESGSPKSNAKWILGRLKEWQAATEKYADLPIACLITVALTSLIDLDERIKDRAKKKLLDPIITELQKADDWFDAKGRSFGHYETADEVMGLLYGIIDF